MNRSQSIQKWSDLGFNAAERSEILNSRDVNKDAVTSYHHDMTKRVFTMFTLLGDHSTYSFSEIFVHERIHGSGVEKQHWATIPILGIGLGHDLSGYAHYENILEKCKNPIAAEGLK